ncbi:hypothetical protein FRX31_021192 [Thalictrum thalictroides]|uniref:EF-hand domain-containing protein n=1 Tax=Thalictrum thalictroides TaxID=46969 RepID=A0A7J6VYP6_THATH|nr:hypothetical protein FRX31_021192 [Thalictrum thalictroides]
MENRTNQIKSFLEWFDQNKDGVLNREKLLSLVITVNPELDSTDDEQINGILDEVCKTRPDMVDDDDVEEVVGSINGTCLSEEQKQLKKNLWEKLRQEFWSKITWRKKLDKIKSSPFISDDDHSAEMPLKKHKWALLRYEFCAKITWRKKLAEIKKSSLPHYLEKQGKQ